MIDTNVISERRKKERANKGVRAFFLRAAEEDIDLWLSVVTVSELRRGVEIVRYRGDIAQAVMLEKWLASVLDEFGHNILTVDDEIGQLWGRLRVPHPEHALDKLIAATGLVHDLTVVTRNVDDFSATGVRLLNPFE
ncbi:ribonuclease VapC [Betaproteobacteria bacterium]|nr:ribonuclease VapC [Betaproteobacteria bacterium]